MKKADFCCNASSVHLSTLTWAVWVQRPCYIELDVLAVRKQSQRDFCVRRPVVQDFTWLLENIQYYRANAVHRNEDTLQQLPEDGNLPTFDLFTWVIHQPEPPED